MQNIAHHFAVPTLARWFACMGPCGHSPIAPGTVGSAVAALIGYGLNVTVGPLFTFAVALCVGGLGWLASRSYLDQLEQAAERSPSSKKTLDPKEVVIDEAAGQLIASAAAGTVWWLHLFGFVAFRAFDILKPGLVGQAETLPGASGIMMDDIVAGIAAAALVLLMPSFGLF